MVFVLSGSSKISILHFKTGNMFNCSLSFYNKTILGLVLGMSTGGNPAMICDNDVISERNRTI